MTCREINNITVPYLELDLDPRSVRDVTLHLERCAVCRGEMEAVRQVLVGLKGRTVPDPGERFWTEFPGSMRRRLVEARRDGKVLSIPTHSRRRAWFFTWGAAIAASLAILAGTWVFLGSHLASYLASNQAPRQSERPVAVDLPELTEAEWDAAFEEEDMDPSLVELAGGLDPGAIDGLFKDI